MRKYHNLENEYKELDKRYTKTLSEKLDLELKIQQLEGSVEKQQRKNEEIHILHENSRRLKHDMKNHIMVIASYLNNMDYINAKTYTSEILDKLNSMQSYIETGNTLLNHIINEKLIKARFNGISVKAEIENISFSVMDSIDFSAVLSNLLDNAIEACDDVNLPEIYIRITKKRGYDTILIKNKIKISVLDKNPDLLTTKQNEKSHGIGIKIIRNIVQKYEGLFDYYEENEFFCACVMIPCILSLN